MNDCTRDTANSPEKPYMQTLIYVHNILCMHVDPDSVLTKLDKFFLIKFNSERESCVYLGEHRRMTKNSTLYFFNSFLSSLQ